MLDAEERAQQEREAAKRAKRAAQDFRRDVQGAFGHPEVRRVVWAFLEAAGMDSYAYRQNPHDMVVAAAIQDNARWWLDAIRSHCPERETQMRAEARKAQQDISTQQENGDE